MVSWRQGSAGSPGRAPTIRSRWRRGVGALVLVLGVALFPGMSMAQDDIIPIDPLISTNPNPDSTTVGSLLDDTATLTATAPAPLPSAIPVTGTVTFRLYPPADPTCTGTPVFTSSTVPLGVANVDPPNPPSSSASVPNASRPTATQVGTYHWTATYTPDIAGAIFYNSVTSVCADEPVVVGQATATVATAVSNARIALGGTVTDHATVTGFNPTGTVTFAVYGPNDPTCAGAAQQFVGNASGTVALAGGQADSPQFTPAATGLYTFAVSYSGDANNTPIPTVCGGANETVAVTSITTVASASVQAGGSVTDDATVSGVGDITGSVTFTLHGPSVAPVCTPGNQVGTSIVNLPAAPPSATKTVTSGGVTVSVAGTYWWVAVYSGDANNASVTSVCGSANESVVVAKKDTTVTTAVSDAEIAIGDPAVTDHATVNGTNPTGTVTFAVYGPDDPTCAGAAQQFVGNASGTVALVGGQADSPQFNPTAVGVYTFSVSYSGDDNNNASGPFCGGANETVTVAKADTTIVTAVSDAQIALGDPPVTDHATVTGFNPTGTVTFAVYGPNDPNCAGAAQQFVGDASGTVALASAQADSPQFNPTAAGIYTFSVSYSGDDNNNASGPFCGGANETVTVTSIVTTASVSVPAGGNVTDDATVTGASNITGSVTFTLHGPSVAPVCTPGNQVGVPSVVNFAVNPAAATKTVTSGPINVPLAGTYWWVASYSGNDANSAVTSPCGSANETVVVTKATPTVTTAVSAANVRLRDAPVTDHVIVDSAAATPTGTVTFAVYGPNDPTCAGAPLAFVGDLPGTVNLNGSGEADSPPFSPSATGVYTFSVSYSGDDNHLAAGPICGGANETVTVAKALPTITTDANPDQIPLAVGGGGDTAVVTNAFQLTDTGTVTFTLYGPNNATCTGTGVFTSTVPLVPNAPNGPNGTAISDLFPAMPDPLLPDTTGPTGVGLYRWVASYSGDTNNDAVVTACNDPAEDLDVTKAEASLVTQASPSVPAQVGQVFDTGTVTGFMPGDGGGTVTFTLYGPDNPGCDPDGAAPVFSPPPVSLEVVNDTTATATSPNFAPQVMGVYHWVAEYSGDDNNNASSSPCGAENESVTVTTQGPIGTTAVPASTPLGGSVRDTATMIGVDPTGTVRFDLYGPDDATCAGPVTFTSTVDVAPGGEPTVGTAISDPYRPTAQGTYRWRAFYSGDDNDAPADTPCNDANESVLVGPPEPIFTNASPRDATSKIVPLGTAINDEATVSGDTPTGTVTFTLFGPDNATCSGTPIFTSDPIQVTPVPGLENDLATAVSNDFTPTVTGFYRWIASYSGDDNDPPVATPCNDKDETVQVTQATKILTTTSATVALGESVTDTAVVTGAGVPTGKVSFRLYGPNNATCAGLPIFSADATLSNGSVTSTAFTPTAVGVYRWVAIYRGNNLNAAVTSPCNAPNESVTVLTVSQIATQASAPVEVGGSVRDTALVSGASPTGTVTFTLFGPNNTECTGDPIFTSTTDLSTTDGETKAISGDFTPTAAGVYRWVAVYSGDAANTPATSPCNSVNEAVEVFLVPTGSESGASGGTTAAAEVEKSAVAEAVSQEEKSADLPFTGVAIGGFIVIAGALLACGIALRSVRRRGAS